VELCGGSGGNAGYGGGRLHVGYEEESADARASGGEEEGLGKERRQVYYHIIPVTSYDRHGCFCFLFFDKSSRGWSFFTAGIGWADIEGTDETGWYHHFT
jgi:hypothetical protein